MKINELTDGKYKVEGELSLFNERTFDPTIEHKGEIEVLITVLPAIKRRNIGERRHVVIVSPVDDWAEYIYPDDHAVDFHGNECLNAEEYFFKFKNDFKAVEGCTWRENSRHRRKSSIF